MAYPGQVDAAALEALENIAGIGMRSWAAMQVFQPVESVEPLRITKSEWSDHYFIQSPGLTRLVCLLLSFF